MADEPVPMDNRAMKHSKVGDVPKIGCHDVVTGKGVINYCEADGLMTSAINAHGDHMPPTAIGVMINLDPTEFRPKGQGLLFQMDAQCARDTAASLLKLAAELDPEVAN